MFDWVLSTSLELKHKTDNPANINLFKVNNRNTSWKSCEICSKFTIKTIERRHGRHSGVFIVDFEHISNLFLVFLLLTLNKKMLAGKLNFVSWRRSSIFFINPFQANVLFLYPLKTFKIEVF